MFKLWLNTIWALIGSAWTTPATWSTTQLVTASDLNEQIRDNLSALKAPPTDYHVLNEGADYTLNSAVFADVDGTNLSLTITTTGGDVFVGFHGNFSNDATTRNLYLDVTMDGVAVGGNDGIIAERVDVTAAPGAGVSFTRLIPGVAAGTHTFNLTYKVSAGAVTLYAGAGTSGGDLHGQFWVREMS